MSSKATQTVGTYWNDPEQVVGGSIDIALSEANMCSWNLRLSPLEDSCSEAAIAPMYADVIFLPLDHEVEESVEVDGYDREHLVTRVVRRVNAIQLTADEYHRNLLYELIGQHSRIEMLQNIGGAEPIEAFDLEIEDERLELPLDSLFQVTIRFKISDLADLGTTECCNDIFEGAPFENPCEDPDPEVCEGFAISLSEAGGVVTAEVDGAPGDVAIRLMYRPMGGSFVVLSEDASMVSLGAYGEYRFIAISGTCRVEDSYVYLDPCGGFAVSLSHSGGGVLETTVSNGGTGLAYTWSQLVEGVWTVLPDIGGSITVEESGTYKVEVVNDDSCEASDIVIVNLDDTCTFTGTLAAIDGQLIVTLADVPDGSPAPIFAWALDNTGDGFEAISGSTGTIPLQGDGLYTVDVTIGDCTITIQKLVLNSPAAGGILHVTVQQVDNYLLATVVEAGPFTYQWYKQPGSGIATLQIIEGATDYWLVPDQNGIYVCVVRKEGAAGSDANLYDDSLNLGYHHIQETPSTTWTMPHGDFGFTLTWEFFDTDGNEILPWKIERPNNSTTIAHFTVAVPGEGWGS